MWNANWSAKLKTTRFSENHERFIEQRVKQFIANNVLQIGDGCL